MMARSRFSLKPLRLNQWPPLLEPRPMRFLRDPLDHLGETKTVVDVAGDHGEARLFIRKRGLCSIKAHADGLPLVSIERNEKRMSVALERLGGECLRDPCRGFGLRLLTRQRGLVPRSALLAASKVAVRSRRNLAAARVSHSNGLA